MSTNVSGRRGYGIAPTTKNCSDFTITFPGGGRVYAATNGQVIKTSQPLFGRIYDSYPSSLQTFLASIGTGIGACVLAFCNEQRIPVLGFHLKQHNDLDSSGVKGITIEIQVPLDFPVAYQWDLYRAAENCVVKQAMRGMPEIRIKVVLRREDHEIPSSVAV